MVKRLDSYVNEQFNTGREKAKELIKDGKIIVNNKVILKPSYEVSEDDDIVINEIDYNKYVSRGAYKLLQAIEEFDIKVDGKICIDIGASTGGFTDVLLQCGATKVVSVDTGTLQLHHKLRTNPKVVSLENTNILSLSSEEIGKFDIMTVDVSFVSIKKIMPHIITLMNNGCECIFLVKPQFEVGQNKLNKKGVVKNIKDREKVLAEVIELCKVLNLKDIKTNVSNTVGHSGNIEYLLNCTREV